MNKKLNEGSRIYSSDKYKTIFVRVPKTGSNSIIHSIGNIFDKKNNNTLPKECRVPGGMAVHIPASDIAKHMPEIWKNYFTFGFIRNPYYQVISSYYQVKNKAIYKWPSLYNLDKLESIESYVPYILECFPTCRSIKQEIFLFDSNGNQLVDYIGKYENLQSDYKFICKKIGIKYKPLERINANQTNVDYDSLLTPYLKSMIAYELRDTFEILGYKI